MLKRGINRSTIWRVQYFFNGSNFKVCKFWLKVSTEGKYTGNKQLALGILTWNILLFSFSHRVLMCAHSGTRQPLWGLTLLLANCVTLTKIFTFFIFQRGIVTVPTTLDWCENYYFFIQHWEQCLAIISVRLLLITVLIFRTGNNT